MQVDWVGAEATGIPDALSLALQGKPSEAIARAFREAGLAGCTQAFLWLEWVNPLRDRPLHVSRR